MFGLFGLVMIAAAVIGMYRIAEMQKEPPVLWAGITLVLCLASGYLGVPLVEIGLAFVASLGLLTVKNMIK